ncbi:MAG: HlyD family efflux transporter periplasmic adaptor subunit [Betaproteobacteria bacterium]|nr:HlyD family efflux transporter periplasmic adaptor subunit [Betaproteobacteria bacterium]
MPKGQPLFRSEALAHSQNQWLGKVLLASPLSQRVFVVFVLVAVAALLAFLVFGEYTRKARVAGWLVPQQGLVKVLAPQAGVVVEVRVREGTAVRAGQPLMVLSAERQSAAMGATQAQITRLLEARQGSLAEERGQQEQLLAQQREALARRVEALRAEDGQIGREIELQRARVRLAEEAAARHGLLQSRGFISPQQRQEKEAELLDQRSRLGTLQRALMTTRRDLVTLQAELDDLPLKAQARLAEITRSIDELDQERVQSEALRRIVLPAPQDGVVTAIQAEAGSSVGTTTPLLSIVPANAQLEAHLFGTSRAIGFVRPGQPVLLRLHAYPYQKFGHQQGTVGAVSRSAVSPAELPPHLAGMQSLYGSGEPVYRISVRLERQHVTAYGRPEPLAAGMQLEADVLLDRRRLIEWMFEPLFSLTGKI